jgi:hypothetical protein
LRKSWTLYNGIDSEAWKAIESIDPGMGRQTFTWSDFYSKHLTEGIHRVSVMGEDNIGAPSNAISMGLTVWEHDRMNSVSLSSGSLGAFPEGGPTRDQIIQFQFNDSAINKSGTMYRRFDSELWDSLGSVNRNTHSLTFENGSFAGKSSAGGTHGISLIVKDSDGVARNGISFEYKV